MISPEHVRRICWNRPVGSVDQALTDLGARPWQREIAVPILELALLEEEPLEIPQSEESEITEEKSI
jgi:ribonuclease D